MTDRQLSEKQQLFLTALANDAKGDIRTAMNMAGYSPNTAVKEVLSSLTDEIITISKQLLAANSVKAAIKMASVLDTPGTIGNDRLISAAKEILDRAGVIKKEEQQTTIKADTIVILPSKDSVAKAVQGE